MSNDITDGVLCFSFFFLLFFFLLALDLVLCVRACVHACECRAAIFNMATILKLVCVKGLRGYARFAVLFLPMTSHYPFFINDSYIQIHICINK